jgi:aspartyl-tRNA(Asn)/glutamyl-tRNA(Gln) amidotransferase subunit B
MTTKLILPSSIKIIIGVELHARINTISKLFSPASSCTTTTTYNPPNSLLGLFDIGIPGTLPTINHACVDQTIRTGLAFGGNIQKISRFERKHYFYHDQPLGFQITQHDLPLVLGGKIQLPKSGKTVHLTRIQLEQDTGKSTTILHNNNLDDDHIIKLESTVDNDDDEEENLILVDFNRAGVGLMEIVSEPDMNSGEEAAEFVETVRDILVGLNTCDGKMQDGSLRADVNISIFNTITGKSSHRVEIKNLNSLRSIERAVQYESIRLSHQQPCNNNNNVLINSNSTQNETRGFEVKSGTTYPLRLKETSAEYRFMIEPDLMTLILDDNRIQSLQNTLPLHNLPHQQRLVLIKITENGLQDDEIEFLVKNPILAQIFQEILKQTITLTSHSKQISLLSKLILKWLTIFLGEARKYSFHTLQDIIPLINPNALVELIQRIEINKTDTAFWGKHYIEQCCKEGKQLPIISKMDDDVVKKKEEKSVSDKTLQDTCTFILNENQDEVNKYLLQGKKQIINVLVGKVVKMTKGTIPANQIKLMLEELLRNKKL